MARKRKVRDVTAIAAEGPARILDTHKQDRFVSRGDRVAAGYRNVSWPIQMAYEAGRLSGGSGDANIRWASITEYSDIHDTALCRSGRDSTDMDVVRGGAGFPITEAVSDAIKKLISIDSHMSRKDRQIVRKLCEGYTLPQAVKYACGDDFTDTVAARVRDALDALDQALTDARENGYRYVRMTGS